MIIITGAAGFIGSNLTGFMSLNGYRQLVLADSFNDELKNINLHGKSYVKKVDRDLLFDWIENNHPNVEFVIHLGARTNTAEFDKSIFDKLNLGYSKKLWNICAGYSIPLIYASSAATYGNGEFGYNDDHDIVEKLVPLNPYGDSKNDFDKWVLCQEKVPPFWAGLKFFNVYGPNEYHKGRMASVVFHAFNQISDTGKMKLFRSHKEGIPDGGQMRDFVYVKDVVDIIHWLFKTRPSSGLYNLGTGKARTFLDLINATFRAMDLPSNIEFIDTPIDIRDKYQYFTEANMAKIKNAGYKKEFYPLEAGVNDYVRNYLKSKQYY